MSEPIDYPAVSLPPAVLLVENTDSARNSLTRILRGRGYEVTPASNRSQAILEAKHGTVGVVIMDVVLGDELDGIDVAEEIQKLHPLVSFIFVTGSADLGYHERALKKKIQVGGWIEKPLSSGRVGELVGMIEQERQKLAMLASLQVITEQGEDPFDYLRQHEKFLHPRVAEEIREALYAENDLLPLQPGEEIPDVEAIARKVDETYDEIRDLIAKRTGDPGLEDALRPLREKLRALQEEEAEAIELRFRSQVLFDPREGREVLRQVQSWLGKI
jgi:CheY-like chemotaxis protein